MTERNDRSYVRFPETVKTIPEKSLRSESAKMASPADGGKEKPRLQDQPTVTRSQNAFAAAELEE